MGLVFVTRRLPGDALERLSAAGHEVDVWEERLPPPRAALLERAGQADALLCTLVDPIDGALLDACPRVKTVANYGVGYDNIDVAAATARGVAVSNTPDVLTDATADLAFALLLAAARRLPQTAADVLAGRWGTWEPGGYLGHDVAGATLGIVGAGRIGEAVARRAAGFDMTVLRSTSRAGTPLPELLERSDFVSLHVPLTPATRHLIDAAALRRMKPTAILVNTARGGVVDTDALTAALHAGTIGGAALDVTDPEPLPADHPLLQAPNVLVVPHIGSATTRTRTRMSEIAVDNVLAGLAGRPLPQAVSPPMPSPTHAA
ncbi:D-glycerate dehydrogenase [Conexibacter stalactiti]|uniref:D-glycerate dehydrogenase n=1 Tax=Conexibacter stalactiti TaxID=1940611 RepID=A0ABU4HSH8_9ACTN|nr:D-glycerate dehydrogenase [Conexibacter stalactiti]MDW5596277.1 D-glycerate dehydrogenase [Conexibacter stalactiti]MEC5036919.1 D-glycerate dehydrogenase [Conexibacter stalactiti]